MFITTGGLTYFVSSEDELYGFLWAASRRSPQLLKRFLVRADDRRRA
jgi:hypothetical protein